jgi:hypothetical protein
LPHGVREVDGVQSGIAGEGPLQQVGAGVAAGFGGDVDLVAREGAADHGRDRAGGGVHSVQSRNDDHPHRRVLPPVPGDVEVDDLLLAADLQAQELPACRSAGLSTST